MVEHLVESIMVTTVDLLEEFTLETMVDQHQDLIILVTIL